MKNTSLALFVLIGAALIGAIYYISTSSLDSTQVSNIDTGLAPLPEGREELGYELAANHCAGCHEIAGRGQSPIPSAPSFGELAGRWPVDYLAEALAEGILVEQHEDIQMPEFVLQPEEIDNLLAYLKTLQ